MQRKMWRLINNMKLLLLLISRLQAQFLYLSLGSTNITTNNTEVLITDIGEDASGGLPSLICHTDLTECCRGTDTTGRPLGEWHYPDGRVVKNNSYSRDSEEYFYRVRNAPQIIRLARRENAMPTPLSPTGPYCCTMPTTGGDMTICTSLVVCLSLPRLGNETISYSDPTIGVNTVAIYSCDNETGVCARTCQSDGTWSGLSVIVKLGTSAVAGQDFSLTCFVTGAGTVDLTYQLIQNVSGETVVRGTQNTPVFTFNPLLLSDGGLYSCSATITTRTSSLTVTSEEVSLFVHIPLPIVSIGSEHMLSTNQTPQLQCMVYVNNSIVNVPVTVNIEWNSPRGTIFSGSFLFGLGSTTILQATVNVTGSGNYSCNATVFPNSSLTYVIAGAGIAKRNIMFVPDSVLFQFKFSSIDDCQTWIGHEERIEVFTGVAVAEIKQHCQCGFSSKLITESAFHCFTASPTAVTYRAILENSSHFLPVIQTWIHDDGILRIQNISLEVDKNCPLVISNFTDPECISVYSDEDDNMRPSIDSLAAIVGGGIAGAVSLLFVILLVVVMVSLYKSRSRRKLIPPTSHKLGEVAVTTETGKTDHQSHDINSIGNKEEGHKSFNILGLAVSNESKNLPTKSVSPPSLSSLHKRPPTHHLVDLQHDGPAIVESRTTKCVAYHAVRHDY